MAWNMVAGQAVLYGLALSVAFTVVLMIGYLVAPDFLVHDYPPAIRDRYGPESRRGKRMTTIASIVFALTILAALSTELLAIRVRTGAPLSFGAAFVAVEVLLMTGNAFDLLVIDLLVIVVLLPHIVVLPGTEGMAEYRDWRFHMVGFAKGTVMMSVLAVVTAAVVAGLETLT